MAFAVGLPLQNAQPCKQFNISQDVIGYGESIMPVAYMDSHAGEFGNKKKKTLDFFFGVEFVSLRWVFACRPYHSCGCVMIMSSQSLRIVIGYYDDIKKYLTKLTN